MSASAAAKVAESLTATFQTMGKDAHADLIYVSNKLMSRLASPLLLKMGLDSATKSPVRLLDTACGTGPVVPELQGKDGLARDVLSKSSFLCADNSEWMVEVVKGRIQKEGWVNAEAKVLDAQNTGLEGNSFTHVSACLALHLTPDPDAVVKDAMRILQPGGIFGASTFPSRNGRSFWYTDLKDAFQAMPFDAPLPDQMPMQLHKSGHWDDEAWVETHLTELGLRDVAVTVEPGSLHVEDGSDFVRLFGMMIPFVLKSFWTEEMREAHPAAEVTELVRQHLDKKHEKRGWSLSWEVIYMTGKV